MRKSNWPMLCLIIAAILMIVGMSLTLLGGWWNYLQWVLIGLAFVVLVIGVRIKRKIERGVEK